MTREKPPEEDYVRITKPWYYVFDEETEQFVQVDRPPPGEEITVVPTEQPAEEGNK